MTLQTSDVDYVDIVQKTVGTMKRIPSFAKDEALSEAFYAAASCLPAFDTAYGVPLEAYLCQKIRWALLNWQKRELKESHEGEEIISAFTVRSRVSVPYELKETVSAARRVLDRNEYLAVMGSAIGMTTPELSKALHLNGKQLEALKAIARKKLIDEMGA